MKLAWAGSAVFSRIIHEENSIPEEDWQNQSLAILRKHCAIFIPAVVCTICILSCIPETLTHLRLSLKRKGMVQTVYAVWRGGGGKTLLTLSSQRQFCFHLWWQVVVHNLLFRVEKGGAEGQKFSVIRTSPSIYTARLDEGRKESVIYLSWKVLNF